MSTNADEAGAPELGDLVQRGDGRWVTHAPTHCPAGHHLTPNRVLVGHAACTVHGGHTTWRCLECDTVTYGPPLTSDCAVLNGPADVRNSFRSSSNSSVNDNDPP